MTWTVTLAVVAVVALVGAELAARLAGLHRPLIYERTSYGYRVSPGQHARLLTRTASYDAHGLRSAPFSGPPGRGQVRILCIGDSITNGGLRVDQSETWPALLQAALRSRGKDAQVLNASAGGWALENEAGWLAEHGVFGSQVVVFEVGTHDLWQPRASESTVGRHPAFPDRVPVFALHAALVRYVLPRVFQMITTDPGTVYAEPTAADIDARLTVLKGMVDRARREGAVPVLLHMEQPHPHEVMTPLVVDAKRTLREWASMDGIPYINPRDAIERAGGAALFFDPYHPNAGGNRVIAAEVARHLEALQ